MLQKKIFGIPVDVYDEAIEQIAQAVENGALVTEAVQSVIKDVRDTYPGFQEEDFVKLIEDLVAGKNREIRDKIVEEPPKGESLAPKNVPNYLKKLNAKSLNDKVGQTFVTSTKRQKKIADNQFMKTAFEIVIKIILALLFMLCLLDMPYGYYQVVRFAGMFGFALLAYSHHTKNDKLEVITYIGLALLFQPFLKLALGRTIWNIVDVAVSIGLIASLFVKNKRVLIK